MRAFVRRLRLFHKLFLLLAATAAVSALAMAGVLSWNLQRGFNSYLRQRDAEMLDDFTAAAQHYLAGRPLPAGAAGLDGMLRELVVAGLVPEGRPPFQPMSAAERARASARRANGRRCLRRLPPLPRA